ncbi:MAG: hypothetical protein OSP8Acid_17420 [uncultured Acidilobus sp. OSP8]|nr:MAG: hypothetical protein OSP8Acid_17420 [uncultured Acidilobus sp. OSP8]
MPSALATPPVGLSYVDSVLKRVVLPALFRPTTHGTLAEGLSETPSGPHAVG